MDYIRDKGWCRGIDEGKIHYINNGVDLQSFNDNKENCITEDVDLLNTETFKWYMQDL